MFFNWSICGLFFFIFVISIVYIFLKKWAILGLFFVYFRLFKQTSLQLLQQINVKMSTRYTVLGFKPTTFGTWVSSHNHKTRSPAINTIHLIHLKANKIANNWIRNGVLWCWKRPLYQLRHNHCQSWIATIQIGTNGQNKLSSLKLESEQVVKTIRFTLRKMRP